MKLRFLMVVVVFVFVVMVSGCPDSGFSGSSFAMGNGMQINSFEFKPAKLVSGQATLLKLEIQNMGSLNVEDLSVDFYGLSNEWTGETIGDFSEDFEDHVVDIPEGLRSANAEFKTEGQKQVIVWRLTSPKEYLEGTEFTHRAYARVCYPYETNVVAKVEVVGEDEWLVMEQGGKFTEHPIDVKQTAAPIQVQIESMQPIIVDNSMSMELKVSNVGGGVAFVGEDDEGLSCAEMFDSSEVDVAAELNNVVIEGLEEADCKVLGEAGGDVWLSRGQERTITVKCDGFYSGMPKQEFNLNIKFKYNYYIDAETSVVLEGVEGEDGEPMVFISEGTCGFQMQGAGVGAAYKVKGDVDEGVCEVSGAIVINIPVESLKDFDVTHDGDDVLIVYDDSVSKTVGINSDTILAEFKCMNGADLQTRRYVLRVRTDKSVDDCGISMSVIDNRMTG